MGFSCSDLCVGLVWISFVAVMLVWLVTTKFVGLQNLG